MEYVFGIIILLGALIFFHELGHFLVAKYCGVKVEAFSLGFGPKIIKKKVGETEYCLSLIPLGGYVKLFGEDPTNPVKGKEAQRSFSNQPVWRRIAIAAAGPLFNILFAIIVYFIIEVGGLEKVIVPYLADVEAGSPAWDSGLRPGDKIVSLNGKKVISWDQDFLQRLAEHPGETVRLAYLRRGAIHEMEVVAGSEESWNLFCERETIGVLKGVSVRAAAPVVGISDPRSWAARAGFQTGDRILSIDHVTVSYWHQVASFIASMSQNQDLLFRVQRGGEELEITLPKQPPEYHYVQGDQKVAFTGFHTYEFFVRHPFEAGTAGAEAGLKVGDRLDAFNGKPIQSWDEFKEEVQLYGERPGYFNLRYEREGTLETVRIVPKKVPSQHPCESDQNSYQMGILIDVENIYPPLQLETYRVLNPVTALYHATAKSFLMAQLVLTSVVKMIQGKVSMKSVGGPILIGKVAGDHLKRGLLPFLLLLAAISINLAILNFLPIPVLDGGHLLFFFYEVIFRRRPTERALEVANRAGLAVILVLVVFAFYNDLSRYWGGIVDFLKRLVGAA